MRTRKRPGVSAGGRGTRGTGGGRGEGRGGTSESGLGYGFGVGEVVPLEDEFEDSEDLCHEIAMSIIKQERYDQCLNPQSTTPQTHTPATKIPETHTEGSREEMYHPK